MPATDRAGEALSLKRYLSQFSMGTVLVVGARSTNFPDVIREHPRINIWDSTDPDVQRGKPIPASTRAIISLRFVSHQTFATLQRYAKKSHTLMVPGLNNTGEVRQLLTSTFDLQPEPPPPPPLAEIPEPETPAPPSTHNHPPMTTRQFVRTYGDRTHLPMMEEARRLHALAPQYGVTTTLPALQQQLSVWHRATPPPPQTETAAPAPSPVQAPSPLPIEDDRRLGNALRLIEDAQAALTLLHEELQRLSDDDTQAHATITALRQLLNKTA